MTQDLAETVRRLAEPLLPEPTGQEARLEPLNDIRAVLFDIYGTLIVSGSGDIGTTVATRRGEALGTAVAAAGGRLTGDPEAAIAALDTAVASDHAAARDEGRDYPEVEIRDIWAEAIAAWTQQNGLDGGDLLDIATLAIEYEMRINPVWPMPGVTETLAGLIDRSVALGIVSNAQFYTPIVVEALLAGRLDSIGFDPQLCYYSYRHRHAKPGETLYRAAQQRLASKQINPAEVLFVGNDVRNDIRPAAAVGFRTALFAGDARSLRLREDDDTCRDVRPDVVLTDLRQILQVVGRPS